VAYFFLGHPVDLGANQTHKCNFVLVVNSNCGYGENINLYIRVFVKLRTDIGFRVQAFVLTRVNISFSNLLLQLFQNLDHIAVNSNTH